MPNVNDMLCQCKKQSNANEAEQIAWHHISKIMSAIIKNYCMLQLSHIPMVYMI